MRAVNLIPADQRSGRSVGAGRSGGGAYAILGVLAGVALMALLYGIAHHQYNSRQKEAATLSAQAQQTQSQAAALAPYTSFVAMRQQRVAAVEELVNSRFDWAHTFHEVARVLPTDASISSLTGTVGGTGGSSGQPGSSPSPAPGTSGSGSSSSASSGSAGSSGSTGSSGSSSSSTSANATSSAGPSAAPGTAPATGGAVTSATPAGSVPTFIVQGCGKSQSVVAKTINRLRLIDGVASVTLQSSTASSTATGGGATGSGQCPPHSPAYQLLVTFQPLPSSSEVTSAAKSATVVVTKKGAKG